MVEKKGLALTVKLSVWPSINPGPVLVYTKLATLAFELFLPPAPELLLALGVKTTTFSVLSEHMPADTRKVLSDGCLPGLMLTTSLKAFPYLLGIRDCKQRCSHTFLC
jgi:hypothetical protein